jgi:hypothetical protein
MSYLILNVGIYDERISMHCHGLFEQISLLRCKYIFIQLVPIYFVLDFSDSLFIQCCPESIPTIFCRITGESYQELKGTEHADHELYFYIVAYVLMKIYILHLQCVVWLEEIWIFSGVLLPHTRRSKMGTVLADEDWYGFKHQQLCWVSIVD